MNFYGIKFFYFAHHTKAFQAWNFIILTRPHKSLPDALTNAKHSVTDWISYFEFCQEDRETAYNAIPTIVKIVMDDPYYGLTLKQAKKLATGMEKEERENVSF